MKPTECSKCFSTKFVEKNGRIQCASCGAYQESFSDDEEERLMGYADLSRKEGSFIDGENRYTTVIEKFPNNVNAYWGRLLCKHGILYNTDYDGTQVPTCCCPRKDSILLDSDYKKVLELSSEEERQYFSTQAKIIDKNRRLWFNILDKEENYDIFLSYKDSDLSKGVSRTQDSIDVQDIYQLLTNKGYKVFYSRISLQNISGENYDPYILNALQKSKVFILYSSSLEYINSTWIKNEWKRYAKLIKEGEKEKNSMLVVLKGMSPSELPLELIHKQVFDANRVSFSFDLLTRLSELIDYSKNEEKIGGKDIQQKEDDVKDKELVGSLMKRIEELEKKQDVNDDIRQNSSNRVNRREDKGYISAPRNIVTVDRRELKAEKEMEILVNNGKIEDLFTSYHHYFRRRDRQIILSKLKNSSYENAMRILSSTDLHNPLTIWLVNLFFGVFGLDRFLIKDYRGGFFKLFTFGGFFLTWFFDIFRTSKRVKLNNLNEIYMMIK